MSAISFWTKVEWGLPHLSFILHKPETQGTDFDNVAFSVDGSLLLF